MLCTLYILFPQITKRFHPASRIIEKDFNTRNFAVENDHSLRIYDTDLSVSAINRSFIENGLEVSEAHTCEDSLEDYFKHVTGGEGIA